MATVSKILLLAWAFTSIQTAANSAQGDAPRAGEHMEFHVWWTKILVGKIKVTDYGFVEREEGVATSLAHKIQAYTRTDGAVEHLYKDKRKYIGYLKEDHAPWIFEEWEKNKKKWRLQEWLEFGVEEGVLKRFKKGKLRSELGISESVYDPVSAVYALRDKSMEPGDVERMEVTEGKHLYLAEATISEGPTLETIIGSVPTVEASLVIYWEGEPLGNRTMKVWFTANKDRIPIRLFADCEFGSFTAELIEYIPPKSEAATQEEITP